jgi:small nuclear ribonucleoprotein (snRNP)-like protein
MEKMSFKAALIWIFASIIVISGPCYLSFFMYKKVTERRSFEAKYNIKDIVQPQMENRLSSDYLAQLLSLSYDRPTNLFLFDVKMGEKELLKSPFIKEAKIKKVGPSSLYIDYVVRTPMAILSEVDNAAIDEEGVIFPLNPIFSREGLLQICLSGTDKYFWGGCVKDKEEFILAMNLVELLNTEQFSKILKVSKIDVSRAFVKSYGKREVVIACEDMILLGGREFIFPKLLRLDPKNYEGQLFNFLNLLNTMSKDYMGQLEGKQFTSSSVRFSVKVIDLRVDKLAFIDENEL